MKVAHPIICESSVGYFDSWRVIRRSMRCTTQSSSQSAMNFATVEWLLAGGAPVDKETMDKRMDWPETPRIVLNTLNTAL